MNEERDKAIKCSRKRLMLSFTFSIEATHKNLIKDLDHLPNLKLALSKLGKGKRALSGSPNDLIYTPAPHAREVLIA
jgi:hypothetical protein